MALPSVGRNELLILSALSGAAEIYGREIVARVGERTQNKVRLSLGGLYTTLHRMEEKGLISGRWGETTVERAGARRRYYRITGLGERVLRGEGAVWAAVLRAVPARA